MKKWAPILLFILLFFSAFLRFFKLGEVPVGLSGDEVDLSYNSYSLLKTGRDVSGRFWPISLQTFIDVKPSLLAYLLMIPVSGFGLNELSVRVLPAALGVLTILFFYLLVLEMFGSFRLALIASTLLAFSPWHLHLSRGVFEVNVAGFFVISGLYLFFRARRSPFLLPLAGFLLGLSLYAYHSTKFMVPALLFLLAVFYFKELKAVPKKMVLLSFIIFLVLAGPAFGDYFFGPGNSRYQEVSLFASKDVVDGVVNQRGYDQKSFLGGRLFQKT